MNKLSVCRTFIISVLLLLAVVQQAYWLYTGAYVTGSVAAGLVWFATCVMASFLIGYTVIPKGATLKKHKYVCYFFKAHGKAVRVCTRTPLSVRAYCFGELLRGKCWWFKIIRKPMK